MIDSRLRKSMILPAILAGFVMAATGPALAENQQTVKIVNKLSDDLTSGEVLNRQDIQVKSQPPTTVAADGSGTFKIANGDSMKNMHLKVQYQVGTGTAGTVTFGFNSPAQKYPDCFVETSDTAVVATYSDCQSDTPTFTFSPKN